MPIHSAISIRIYAGVFGILLALQSIWLIAAETARPAMLFFPIDATQANAAATQHSAAAAAAHIGWLRGALWVDNAIAASAATLSAFESGNAANAPAANSQTLSIDNTAAALAPADARGWILLAMASEQTASKKDQALAQLKMSYYTAPYNEYLFPLRIQIVARLSNINDEELRGFIEYELRMVHDRPNFKYSIASAFGKAGPAGRQFFEATLAKIDPKFLAQLRTANP